jgi:hypothetical protein
LIKIDALQGIRRIKGSEKSRGLAKGGELGPLYIEGL